MFHEAAQTFLISKKTGIMWNHAASKKKIWEKTVEKEGVKEKSGQHGFVITAV